MRLYFKFSENDFVRVCAEKIIRNGTTIFEDVYDALCHFLSLPIYELGIINDIRHRYKSEYYDNSLSLPEYIGHGSLELSYPSIDLYSDKDVHLDVDEVNFPEFIKLKDIYSNYGGVKKEIKVKTYDLKTKNKITVEFFGIVIPKEILIKIYDLVKDQAVELTPSRLQVWEWQQTFYNKISGECFFCECFRRAIKKSHSRSNHPHIEYALKNNAFKKGICHICTGTNSDLFFCHPMYASSFKVKYGAYIRKFEIDNKLNEIDAENKVRELKGVAKIGEKWINETLLFNYIDLLFPGYSVEREASPEWLGNQRLDIFISELQLAVEYQGQQHFKAVELFGGGDGFAMTKQRDMDKLGKCKKNGIDLVYFTYKDNLSEKLVAQRLKKYVNDQKLSKKIAH